MKAALLAGLVLTGFAQTPAVFRDFAPGVKGMEIGASHVYLWAHVNAPWDSEAACYVNGAIVQIQVRAPGSSMLGSCPMGDGGIITWMVTPNGEMLYWQMTAQPNGGVAIYREGSF